MEAARIISLPGQPDTQPVRKISEDSASGQLENVRIILTKTTRGSLEEILGQAGKKGDLRGAKRVMAILAMPDGHSFSDIASLLNVHERTVCRWFGNFLLKGPDGIVSRKPPGRKSKLTKSQKRELDRIITAGPQTAGFSAACWRSPMLQALIYEKFGVLYAVNYISRLLKDMGFSWQKARFVADRQHKLLKYKEINFLLKAIPQTHIPFWCPTPPFTDCDIGHQITDITVAQRPPRFANLGGLLFVA